MLPSHYFQPDGLDRKDLLQSWLKDRNKESVIGLQNQSLGLALLNHFQARMIRNELVSHGIVLSQRFCALERDQAPKVANQVIELLERHVG